MNKTHADLIARTGLAAYEYERDYHGCSQCVLAALQNCLGLGNRDSFKLETALAGGVARMGTTCGSLVGGIMAIGLAFGREVLEDSVTSQGYARAMDLGGELCVRFEKEFGSTQCREIQQSLFGRSFDLRNPQERKDFHRAGSYEKCPQVARRAAELAAEVILAAGYEPQGGAPRVQRVN